MTAANRKKKLREASRLAASAFGDRWRRTASAAVWERVEALPEFAASRVAALYWSLPDEVFSHDFVRKWAGRKQILLPAVCGTGDGETMTFRTFDPESELTPGRFGIPECAGREFPPAEIDLIVVPGMAFDPSGNRLGRGKGFYDRFLAAIPNPSRPFKVGVCFAYQFIPEIPADPHDVKMDIVIYN